MIYNFEQVIKVGLLFSKDTPSVAESFGYQGSASAVLIAVDQLRKEGYLVNYTISYHWFFDECDQKLSVGYVSDLIFEEKVDVIIGPSCPACEFNLLTGKLFINICKLEATILASNLVRNYNFPLYLWGLVMPSELGDDDFPSVSMTVSGNYQAVIALMRVLTQFSWNVFAFAYTSTNTGSARCPYLHDDLETLIGDYPEIKMSYNAALAFTNDSSITDFFEVVKTRARIVVICADEDDERRAMLKNIVVNKIDITDYVIIYLETRFEGFGTPRLWVDSSSVPDGLDDDIQITCKHIDTMDIKLANITIRDEVLARMKGPPFNCTTDCEGHDQMATAAPFLADAMYLYGRGISKIIEDTGKISKDGAKIIAAGKGDYQGWFGDYYVNEFGDRRPQFFIYGLDSNMNIRSYVALRVNTTAAGWNESEYYNSIWANWNNVQPLAIPVCGFYMENCKPNFMELYRTYIYIGIAIVVVILFILFWIIYCVIRVKLTEKQRADELWKINFEMLLKQDLKAENLKSSRSLESSEYSVSIATARETEVHGFYYLYDEPVVVLEHTARPKLTEADKAILRLIRLDDRENLNKFLGLCINGIQYLSIWKYCSRGSIKGLSYIHSSPIEFHGQLTSSTCLVDERWQVKINDYGLRFIKELEPRPKKTYLWTAPEHLRNGDNIGSKEGDLYSFGIICSEIITKKLAFDYDKCEETLEELVFKIKRLSVKPFRPKINVDDVPDLNPSIIPLIRECWAEDPRARPTVETAKKIMNSCGRKGNLMDHVFLMMEDYAQNLEEEVAQRTQDLICEKKKAELLLYRMLPKQVAEKLKNGESVAPESYSAATVFFSDVVKFTELAAKCSPIQVVSLLNNLYTVFDAVIEERGVYKVETIGDGYLCVSGMPQRNGNDHAREIAEMSFSFLRQLRTFKIDHLPQEKVKIRCGMHTGPVVAGIIGQSMPRYCLFGDTVNTASRMESNGKPGRIHLSPETNRYLTQLIGGYTTKSRGEILIKGKGLMETFWLIPPEGYAALD